MDVINFRIGESDYQLIPHTGFEALNLDRKVLGLIGRMAQYGMDFSDEMNAFATLASTISDMSDSDFRWLVETTLSTVTVVNRGKKSLRLANCDCISEQFAANRNELYAVLLKVWKLEKLSPFAKAPETELTGT